MGSSGGGSGSGFSSPNGPVAVGQPPSAVDSAPVQPPGGWVNFLGDSNTPNTGLTPQMLGQINGTMPVPGAAPKATAMPAQAARPSQPMDPRALRQLLAQQMNVGPADSEAHPTFRVQQPGQQTRTGPRAYGRGPGGTEGGGGSVYGGSGQQGGGWGTHGPMGGFAGGGWGF